MLLCHAMLTTMGMLSCPPAIAAIAVTHAAGGLVEADWIRWTGVAVGMIGAGVVAPAAFELIGLEATGLLHQVERLLKRLYLGKEPPRIEVLGGAALIGASALGGEATVQPGANAPLEVLVQYLMREVDTLRNRIREQERKQRSDHEGLTGRMDRREAEDRAARDALARRLEEDKREDIQLNAKGLPLIALGILLTGVPDGLARLQWIGLAFIALSALLITWLGLVPLSRWLMPKLRRTALGFGDVPPDRR